RAAAVQAVGRVERDADVAGPERVAAAPSLRPEPLDLRQRVNREAPRPLEPELVASALERLQERVPVPGGAVADTRTLLEAGRPGSPDELGTGQQELLVEVLRGPVDDARRSGAPLDADLAVVRVHQVAVFLERPVREPVLDH